MNKATTSFAFAAAALIMAASAFAANPPAGSSGKAISGTDKVHCYGVHECKGNSACATAENACKGQNACKGHGFIAVSAASCLTQNGTIGDLK